MQSRQSKQPERTLLAVHAHPDDESITMGGTLARYSAEGVRTVVVTCTNGALGEVRDAGGLVGAPSARAAVRMRQSSVAALRDRELEAATRHLGISRVVRLGYADSGMVGWPENRAPRAFFAAELAEAADRLVSVIRQERPQVLVTYDATGGYGHPDHVKCHLATVAAFEASGAAQPAKLYFTRIPLTWSREFVRTLRQAGIDAPASAPAGAGTTPDVREIGVPDELVTTAIDVREYLTVKFEALACHASQMPPEHWFMRMPPELRQRLCGFEYFSREAGPTNASCGQPEADLFSGLT